MGKVGEQLSDVVENIGSFLKKIGLVRDIYVANDEGEYSLAKNEDMSRIIDEISRLKRSLERLSRSVGRTERGTIDEINTYLDGMLKETQEGNIDITNITTILNATMQAIKNKTTINIETPSPKGRGGDMGVVSVKQQGEKKNIGGVIVSRNDTELKENIGGDYANVKPVLDIVKNALKQILNLSHINQSSKAEITGEINKIISNNMATLAENCQRSAEGLPNPTKITKVRKANSFAGIYKVIIAGLTAAVLLSGLGKKNDFQIAINDDAHAKVEILGNIDGAKESILNSIGEAYVAFEGAGGEAQTVGNEDVLEKYGIGSGNDDPELIAREEKLYNIQQLENYEKTIENIKSQFTAIKDPTNKDWLEFQIKLNSIYEQMQVLNVQVEDKANKYLDLWNTLNEEHIALQSMPQSSIDAHNKEIELNEESIEKNNEQINEIQDGIDKTNERIMFYNMLKQLPNIEEVKNIEDVSETLNDFLNGDIAKNVGEDNIKEFLKTANLNLFSAYTKYNHDNNDFLEVYRLMDNTYNEYVEEYCNGDSNQVNENQYTQYFTKSLKYMDKLGEQGPVNTLKAMLEQNNINENFYKEYGHTSTTAKKDIGVWDSIGRFIKTLFNGQRRGDYENLIKKLELERESVNIGGNGNTAR